MKVAKLWMSVFFISLGLAAGCASKPVKEPVGNPWFGAARTGDIQALENQLAAGVKVDQASPAETTALHIAAFHGNVQVVKWLIENGADVNKLDIDKTNPLGYALTGQTKGPRLAELVETLIKAGTNPFHESKIGFLPVEEMVERGMGDQLRMLQYTDKRPCDRVPTKGRSDLALSRIARKAGHVEIAEFLDSKGCW